MLSLTRPTESGPGKIKGIDDRMLSLGGFFVCELLEFAGRMLGFILIILGIYGLISVGRITFNLDAC